ncbi:MULTISPECIES: N-acetylglucosamine-6-phosphate deacetylase [unclassified Arcicella]|uniref:N-acetylglucosamine-6-phosphate deacetylase n=1 Tax=unclassified Arcicella TaxID=2644986 RepID=UPI00285E877E|nr:MULTISPECIES: N-acetylglucosamine-6-phosphate deacetylase [unclassified Arcicella]MDR6564165.1 N-acetylglucosamine-6-phosphate deacetylase [Arcicella sp. BE51]MDR6813918.1 N-acetylglucosamine-6-phosphate deacetylase [Arcicella sp. BE140]MDR6825230.1 N-acetylglucosamine-6-phosphate deacetylase [Arcicella sp. BE139]
MYALKNCQIFTSEEILNNKILVIEANKIARILDEEDIEDLDNLFPEIQLIDLKGFNIAPALIDIQIYGGGGSLYNSKTTEETIHNTYLEIRKSGTTHFQITLSSTPLDKILESIAVAKSYLKNGGQGLAGLHLEGPFFSFPKRGAHVAEFIRKPTDEELKTIIEACVGLPTYMTIAPEEFTDTQLDLLLQSDIKIAAGHSSATYQQAKYAFNKGIKRVTHLFNAMSAFQGREPGLVGATYDSEAWASIIPDGIHVDFASVKISKKIMGKRLFIITDAVTNDVSGDYKFIHAGTHYTDTKGTLSGSALTMIQAVINCVEKVNIPLQEALRMASTYPAEVLALDHSLGHIKNGYQANMIIFDDSLNIKGLVENGCLEWF